MTRYNTTHAIMNMCHVSLSYDCAKTELLNFPLFCLLHLYLCVIPFVPCKCHLAYTWSKWLWDHTSLLPIVCAIIISCSPTISSLIALFLWALICRRERGTEGCDCNIIQPYNICIWTSLRSLLNMFTVCTVSVIHVHLQYSTVYCTSTAFYMTDRYWAACEQKLPKRRS